jgi:hypothetical protein
MVLRGPEMVMVPRHSRAAEWFAGGRAARKNESTCHSCGVAKGPESDGRGPQSLF